MVPCLMGLEKIVADELRRLKLADVRAENGHVTCLATLADVPRVNLWLRCGARVLLVLGEFDAPDFEALFQGTRAIAWEDWIGRDGQFPVKGYSISSALHSVPACQSIIKKAVSQRLSERFGMEWLPESGTLYQLQFAIYKNRAILALDTSGEGLYKRGYRAVSVQAPLRETLAAALVILSRYKGLDPFRDPFCGSGTIPIEAAMIAKNRAPGLNRSFSAQKWAQIPAAAWMDAVEEAFDSEFHGKYDIRGGDIDPQAIEIARSNAVKAELEDVVRFDVADAMSFRGAGKYGRLVTNPPYGERLLEKKQAGELYRAFGSVVRQLPPDWRVSILSSHPEFEACLGARAVKRRKLYNGMLKCDLFMYGKV